MISFAAYPVHILKQSPLTPGYSQTASTSSVYTYFYPVVIPYYLSTACIKTADKKCDNDGVQKRFLLIRKPLVNYIPLSRYM